jgi:hypothetical protein
MVIVDEGETREGIGGGRGDLRLVECKSQDGIFVGDCKRSTQWNIVKFGYVVPLKERNPIDPRY